MCGYSFGLEHFFLLKLFGLNFIGNYFLLLILCVCVYKICFIQHWFEFISKVFVKVLRAE